VRRERKAKLSAGDLRELGASARVRRVIPPDGPQRVGVPKERNSEREGLGRRAR
jgi:hypothetical protein